MRPDISIVLPVHDEEDNIGVLCNEIIAVFDNIIRKPYEIIVVDDASADKSADVVGEIKRTFSASPFLVTINLIVQTARNGQSAALMRGMVGAQAPLIVTMDADLQYAPADIPMLLEKIDEYDMICGIRKNRSDGVARLLCSKIANAFRNWITGDSIIDSGCTFRILRRECLPVILPLEGRLSGCEFFFHSIFIRRRGFRVGEIEICHRQRSAGKSNYRLMRGRLIRGIAASIQVRKILKFKEYRMNI
jgi:dolichol-phosphate mannosyltransferase